MTETKNNEKTDEELAHECFPLPKEAEEICNLVIEHEELRWDAFHGVMAAIGRVIEIEVEIENILIKE